MSLLEDSTKRFLLQYPIFSIMQEGYDIKDEEIIAIHNFIKGNEAVMVKNPFHANTLIKDKTIKKIFYSTDIISEFEYLPFVQLGIEYLLEHCEFDNAQKGKIILEKHIHKIEKEITQWPPHYRNVLRFRK